MSGSIEQNIAGAIESGAYRLLASIGNPPPPISALALADAFGLAVKRGFPGLPTSVARELRARLLPERGLIEVCESLWGRELHEAVAHELGHWALLDLGLPADTRSADYMAAALMLPLAHMVDDIGATYSAVCARHLHCSEKLILDRRTALANVPWLFSTRAS